MVNLNQLFKPLLCSLLLVASANLFAEVQEEFQEDLCHHKKRHQIVGATGPTGPTGATGPSGATGATGSGFTFAPAYASFYLTVPTVVANNDFFTFDGTGETNGALTSSAGITGTQFTVVVAGLYNIQYEFIIDASIAVPVTNRTESILLVNGTPVTNGTMVVSSAVQAVIPGFRTLTVLMDLNVGDIVQLQYQGDNSETIGTPSGGATQAYIEFIKVDEV